MRVRYLYVVAFLLLNVFISNPALSARTPVDSSPLDVTSRADGVYISWDAPAAMTRAASPAPPDWPPVVVGGAALPGRLLALRVPPQGDLIPQIDELASVPWSGALAAADVPTPRSSDGEERPDLAALPDPRAPASPLTVLREGRLRGERIVVLAVSPVFAQDGALRVATRLRAHVDGATLLDASAPLLADSGPFLAAAPAPLNPAAKAAAVKVRVTQAGIQSLGAASLAAAGLDLAALDPARLHLRLRGEEVALEQRGAGSSLELRFYAPAPGDRWNAADTYWLTLEATPGLRMGERGVAPGGAPLRDSALERGVWRNNVRYDSTLPGPDGDHWFAADLKTGPDQPPMSTSVILTPTLPLVAESTVLTVTGSAYTGRTPSSQPPRDHTLRVAMDGAEATVAWNGTGDWTFPLTLSANTPNVLLTLVPGSVPSGVELDSVAYARLVQLDLKGRGAAFTGIAGTWRYQPANLPPNAALYDVSNPRAPLRLSGFNGAFEDGPATHDYVLVGPGTLHTPELIRHNPVDLETALNVRLLYIAPAAFAEALTPLVAHRQAQGYSVRVVDVQAIYDAWSFGQIAPDAIRNFLRYAAATWSVAPNAVTLVGDGTSDPLNYAQRNNTTFVPPYLAMVDPWIGETACETCYVQLDGDTPLADTLPDLALGRLPVKSVDELKGVVAKILAYESVPADQIWRSRVLYVADNTDTAGNFAAFAQESAAQLPRGLSVEGIFYDPAATPNLRWHEADPLKARDRVMATLSAGVGIVNYVGHSSQWQWAVTGPPLSPGQPDDKQYLLGLYDVDELQNKARPSIVLEMTCLTAAFQTPAFSGTSIDERLLLKPDGGAVAVWGSSGLGVAHGHEALQRGFYQTLWSAPPMSATMGTLTLGGYRTLLTESGCCEDALRTFLVLGDPMTPARIFTARQVYIPLLRR